ncbi:TPA: SsrA-binding protein [Candidatus Uhrbacteria bacterium]|nr:SsrA-binding protein [Candidatus Uhrbacteria bacterium]
MSTLTINKKARFDYEILETFEGGLRLTGSEVKSIKAGHAQLKGAFLHIQGSELWLKGAFVQAYKPAGIQEEYDPYRDRKVLVHRREINRLMGKRQTKGLTIIPLSVYTKGDLVKLEFALGRGKKKYEKRETLKKRDIQKQMREHLKGRVEGVVIQQ